MPPTITFRAPLYAWPTTATIASGTVQQIDSAKAQAMPGVLAVYTHESLGKLYRVPPGPSADAGGR